MSSNTVVAFGICADNADPWGVGRIRVIIDDAMIPPIRAGFNVREFLTQLDTRSLVKDGTNAYIPWEQGRDGHAPDPYVIEPFLPKHLNIIPKIGESVKIIYYNTGDDNSQREYVAPQISNYDKMGYDSVETARGFSRRTTFYPQQKNFRSNGLVAEPTDIGLLGRKNSEVLLPEEEVILRAGHQDFINQIKNNRNALIQASHYKQRKTTSTEMVNEDQSPAQHINYIFEYETIVGTKTTENPLYIQTNVFIYPVEDVNTKTYGSNVDYLGNDTPEFQITIVSNQAGNISSFINELLKNLDKNKMNLEVSIALINKPETNPTVAYIAQDHRTSEDTDYSSYNLGLYQVRATPKNDFSVQEVQDVKNGVTTELRPLSKRASQQITQVEKMVTQPDPSFDETVVVAGADKLFLLSWHNSNAIQSRMGKYGFSQDEIYLTLQENTEPMVKGSTLLKLIMDLFDLIENHGHVIGVDPVGSLNKDAASKIAQIKDRYALTAPATKDLTGGASILNQYVRLN